MDAAGIWGEEEHSTEPLHCQLTNKYGGSRAYL